MRQTHFAAAARAPASYADWQDRDILSAVLQGNVPQAKTQDNLLNPGISRDVRRLVELHDRGEFEAFESMGPSHLALMNLIKFMKSVTIQGSQAEGLLPEVVAQAARFVKSIPAENIFLRFEVVDKKPALPEYNPAHICAYDADRAYGSDYLQIARRLTITGTTTSVMNDVDLGTLLESGKKKCAVLYMGTQKNDDATALSLTSQMAVNAVVAGIEGGQSVEVIEEQVQILMDHPEIAELYAEVAELKLALTEFKNTLSPEQGKQLVERLDSLTERLELIVEIENPVLQEMLAPIVAIVEKTMTEPMVVGMREILEPEGEEVGSPLTIMEWEDVKEAISLIIADPSLPAELKAEKILALTEQAVPKILADAEPLEIIRVLQDLQTLDVLIQESAIPVNAPLIQIIAENHPLPLIEPQKLLEVVVSLDTPEKRELLKAAIGEGQKAEAIINALDVIAQEISREKMDKEVGKQELLQKLEQALLNPSPETASLVAAIANLQVTLTNPEIVQALPPALQATMAEYALPILAEQTAAKVIGQTEAVSASPLILENKRDKLVEVQKDILSVLSGVSLTGKQSGGSEAVTRVTEAMIRTPEILEVLSPAEGRQISALVLPNIASQLAENKSLPEPLRQEIKEALKVSDSKKLEDVMVKAVPVIAAIAQSAPTREQKTTLIQAATLLRNVAETGVVGGKGENKPVTPMGAVVTPPTPTPTPLTRVPPTPPTPTPTPTPLTRVPPTPPKPIELTPAPTGPKPEEPKFEPKPEHKLEPKHVPISEPVNPQPLPLPVAPEPPPMPEPIKPSPKPRGRCGEVFCRCADPNNPTKPKDPDPVEEQVEKYLPTSNEPRDIIVLPPTGDGPPLFIPPDEEVHPDNPDNSDKEPTTEWGGPQKVTDNDFDGFDMEFAVPDLSKKEAALAPAMK